MAFPPNGGPPGPAGAPPMPPPSAQPAAPDAGADPSGQAAPPTQLTPQDRAALAAAPQAVAVIAKMFPSLAPVLQAIVGNAGAGQDMPEYDAGAGGDADGDEPGAQPPPGSPKYSLPQSTTRLGSM